ncbi:hypothetical protein EHW65_07875 [Erwinia psidii]|nr:hypothetical protein [Erwinia psidii]
MNKKEPKQRKIPQSSFPENRKEPVISRIAKLVERYPSRRQAAAAWGINYSTLQNYFKRANEEPSPRKGVLEAISRCEGVSMEWLLTGVIDGTSVNALLPENPKRTQKEPFETDITNDLSKIVELLKLLNKEDLSRLACMLGLKGAETILYLLDEDNLELLKLDKVVKEKILGRQPQTKIETDLNEQQARECDSDSFTQATPSSLTSGRKQAG